VNTQTTSPIGRPGRARIPQLEVSELPESVRALAGIGASNVLLTMAHRPDLTSAWLEFGMHLTNEGQVPMRLRELMILQVALRTSCGYEWGNHVPGALSTGVTPDEIASLAEGTGAWPAAEAAVLDLVDDLCADDCSSEQTWAALAASYTQGEIIELVLLVGFYRMNAALLNSTGVQLEPGRPELGRLTDYAAPTKVRTADIPVDETQADVVAAGTWALKFYHPAVTQELTLEAVTEAGVLSGSITNEAAGITVAVADGVLHGNRATFTTVMTKPFPATIGWDGVISGDSISGTVDIKDVGSFPFDGTRTQPRVTSGPAPTR